MIVNPNKESLQVNLGDHLIIETLGGEGWGKSAEDPEGISYYQGKISTWIES